MANRSGGVKDRVLDATGNYIVLMIGVTLLFGGTLALALNHVVITALATVLGGIVKELPAGAALMQQISGRGN